MSEETVVTNMSDFEAPEPVKHRKSHYFTTDEYTLDGVFIRNWDSMAMAAEHHDTSTSVISACVLGKILCISKIGRIFLRSGDDIQARLELIDWAESKKDIFGKKHAIEVDEYDLKGKILNRHDSITKAATANHASSASISDCCKGVTLFFRDKIYLFNGASIKERLELIRQKKYLQNFHRSIDEYSRTGKLLASYRNVSEITDKYGISAYKILDCCFGNIVHIYTKIYLFSGENIKERLKQLKEK